jgi:hypothetical protein
MKHSFGRIVFCPDDGRTVLLHAFFYGRAAPESEKAEITHETDFALPKTI